MGLWILPAFLSLLPVPAPIVVPTAVSTVAPTTAPTAAPTIAPPLTSGPGAIEPRLGITKAPQNTPLITGYSAKILTNHTAVKFPKSRWIPKLKYILNDTDILDKIKVADGTHNVTKRQSCSCVSTGTCIRRLIDIRIVTPTVRCGAGQEYCCGNSSDIISCGVRQAVPPSPVTPAPGQASLGEFPWQGFLITPNQKYICGAVLVDELHVLTVAHYFESPAIPVNLTVRLGDWDGDNPNSIPYQDYLISAVIRHPSYNPNTLQNDIAMLKLAAPVPFTPSPGAAVTINRACLPPSASTVYTGQRCVVAGVGYQVFGPNGIIQATIKKVDVPIIDPATCQSLLRQTRLGSNFILDSSFICAGGEANKDACTGDGGSGLVCEVDKKWVLVGLVAWGLGCGTANVPGVYVNVASFLPWIRQQLDA